MIGELGLDGAGVELDERGFVRVDSQMRTSNPGIFAAGDVTGAALSACMRWLLTPVNCWARRASLCGWA